MTLVYSLVDFIAGGVHCFHAARHSQQKLVKMDAHIVALFLSERWPVTSVIRLIHQFSVIFHRSMVGTQHKTKITCPDGAEK